MHTCALEPLIHWERMARQPSFCIALYICVFKILHEHPELIDLPDPDSSHVDITEEMLAQVTAMGFDVDMARAALHHFGADQLRAIDELIRLSGVVPSEWLQNSQSASSSSSSTSTASSKQHIVIELNYF